MLRCLQELECGLLIDIGKLQTLCEETDFVFMMSLLADICMKNILRQDHTSINSLIQIFSLFKKYTSEESVSSMEHP